MRTARSMLVAVIGVTLLGMGLAACGDDDGNSAPGFSLPDSAGGTVSLADYGDEPVLLYFHMAEG